jgi:hypothetical protein
MSLVPIRLLVRRRRPGYVKPWRGRRHDRSHGVRLQTGSTAAIIPGLRLFSQPAMGSGVCALHVEAQMLSETRSILSPTRSQTES